MTDVFVETSFAELTDSPWFEPDVSKKPRDKTRGTNYTSHPHRESSSKVLFIVKRSAVDAIESIALTISHIFFRSFI